MTKINQLDDDAFVKVCDTFEDLDSDSKYYLVKCEAAGLEGWIRQSCVTVTAAPIDSPPSSDQMDACDPSLDPKADCERSAWICRNSGTTIGGATSVSVYSSFEESKTILCHLHNDHRVRIVSQEGPWNQIKFLVSESQETTGWVQSVHLRLYHLITEQPRMKSRAFAAGCPLYLSVQTDNKPGLKYQWQWRSENAKPSEAFADIPLEQGSNKRIFVISAASPRDSGSYRVVVSRETSGPKDQECSDPVHFVVISPPAGFPLQSLLGARAAAPASSTFNVLLMGETGTGKSTFVNLLANHFAPSSFATKENIKVAIKTPHLKVSGEYFSHNGSEAGGAASDAQTQKCSTYSMTKTVLGRGRCTFNFIDSPGLNDPRGKDQDDKVCNVDFLNPATSNF
jgi:hypothetical protein